MSQGIVLCGRWIRHRKEVSRLFPSALFYVLQVDSRVLQAQRRNASDWAEARKVEQCIAAREAAGKGIVPDPRVVALAIAMRTAPPIVPPGVLIIGSAIPPPNCPHPTE